MSTLLDRAQNAEKPSALFKTATQNWSRLYIDGQWREASDKGTFVDLEVMTRKPFAQAADGTVDDMDAAIAAGMGSAAALGSRRVVLQGRVPDRTTSGLLCRGADQGDGLHPWQIHLGMRPDNYRAARGCVVDVPAAR